MPHKDPEKAREYYRQWIEKTGKRDRSEYMRQYYIKEHPNCKSRITYYDFETHRELAINSGIHLQREWYECHKRGFMPEGIYRSPHEAFGRK